MNFAQWLEATELTPFGTVFFGGQNLNRYLYEGVTLLGKEIPGGFEVHMITSLYPKSGQGEEALKLLRAKFGTLIVVDPIGPAEGFWTKMKKRGLVDQIRHSDGVE
jgi:hypothetical protein